MHTITTRSATWAACALMLGSLAACAPYPSQQYHQPAYQQSAYPASGNYQTAGTEYGRVSNIEVLQAHNNNSRPSGAGAILGAVVGGVLGNQVGGGAGRAAATALGAVGGAVVGNNIEGRNNNNNQGYDQAYRITVQLERGEMRVYDVPSPGDLRIGDRVRLYQGQISRM